jgi:predicted ester cyclase
MAEAKDIAARFIEAFNGHDESAIRALNAPNAKFQAPGGVSLEGREAVTGYAMAWLNGFPDAKMTVQNELTCGSWVVQEFTFEGTHTAPLNAPTGTIPATGKRVAAKGVQIVRYENGLAIDDRLYFDQVDVLTQLGLMPTPVAATA